MSAVEEKSDSQILHELGEVLNTIPFDQLTTELTPMTKQLAWRSPRGFGFKITGKFYLYEDGSDPGVYYNNPPKISDELLKVLCSEVYPNYLKEADGDEDRALRILVREEKEHLGEYTPLCSFIGRWLFVDTNPGEIFTDESGKIETELPLNIEGDLEAWYRSDTSVGALYDLIPESDTVISCVYTTPGEEINWKQYCARPGRGGCKIELVAFPEPELKFFIPSVFKEKPMWLPEAMADLYKGNEHYLPNISTIVKKRQRAADQEMNELFDTKGEYFYFEDPETSIFLASKREGKIIPVKKKDKKLD